jgi:UDP-N-acetylglucosamine acyltransferase
VLANGVTIAGHVEIGEWATIGGMTGVHQFVRIGEQTMIAGASVVLKDVPPFVTAARDPLSYAGINTIGLKRRNFSSDEMRIIEDVYRVLFVKGYAVSRALSIIEGELPESEYRTRIVDFVRGAKRGLMKGFRSK